jgi:lysophospholipase L1-like esterase
MSRVVRRAAFACALVLAAIPSAASAQTPPIPSSMASIGDSITRAFNVCGYYVDCPSRSWATGDSTELSSHYRRILAKNPAISGRNYNCAETGADSADLATQASCAVSRAAGYVAILMGANDACKSSEAAMTPITTYRQRVDAALAQLRAGLPSSPIFVSSVPNVYRLWYVLRFNGYAQGAWDAADICQSLLYKAYSFSSTDEARRRRVEQRVRDYNTQLAQACAAITVCKFDNNAVFNYPFAAGDVSTWDYFHPDIDGQRVLANQTYANGFNW